MLNGRLLSLALLLACLVSFRWAMLNFFAQPAGDNAGMKAIRICGFAFAALHLGAIVFTPGVTAGQAQAAALLYLCALGLFWWAVRTGSRGALSAAFSPDTPQHLFDRGPYRFIRHPFYCSYLLTWTAGIVATAWLWLLPSLAVMLVIYVWAAVVEEAKFARSPLASAYERYRSHTGLFFPNPVKLLARRPRSRKGTNAAGLA